MLLAALALAAAQPQPAAAPCNPDAMKSLGCTARAPAPAPRRADAAPRVCNPDPLKGAACHAHVTLARAETQRRAARGDELATAAE